MKRYIILLLSCLMSGSYAFAADTFKCKPQTLTIAHTGGVYSAEIVYDDLLPSGMLPIAPNIETMTTPMYDSKYVEKVDFINKTQFNVTFKMRDKAEQIDGTIKFYFYIKDRTTGVTACRSCTLSYTYPAVISLIGGIISTPDVEYRYGASPSLIRSVMPAMSGLSKNITYTWEKKSGIGQWQNMPDCTKEDYNPDKIGYTTDYYRRIANDGHTTQYSNTVEVHTTLNGGIISMRYTDSSTTFTLTDERTPSVGSTQCSWECSTNLNKWTKIGGNGYTQELSKPTQTTYYRRVAASLDGENKRYSNPVCYNFATPVYITTLTATDSLGTFCVEDRTYYDGIGRPWQTVNVGATPAGNDIISISVYDSKGREADSYLPFTKVKGNGAYVYNALYKQDEYYKKKFSSQTTLSPYTHNEYDSSPLDRIIQTVHPGAEYRQGEGHSIRQTHNLNSEENILHVTLNANDVTGITVNGTYAPNTLYKTIATNEDCAVNETFTDMGGRMILSRQIISQDDYADTYYVYDAADRIRWVISPEGSKRLGTGSSYSIDCELAKKYCYRYTYAGNGQVYQRYIPGCTGPDITTYDIGNRPLTNSTAAMRADNAEYKYTYDALGRIIKDYNTGQLANNNTII